MKPHMEQLTGYPMTREVVSAARYLGMTIEERAAIRTREIVPPTLGSNGFGGILVHYRSSRHPGG